MNLDSLLEPRNPRMGLIWSFARDQYHLKRRNPKQYKEILSVSVGDICGKLQELITGHNMQLHSQVYFRSSMVLSGALRLHHKQTDILLDDTKKLLEAMRREKNAMECVAERLDCSVSHAKGVEPGAMELLFDETDLNTTPRAVQSTVAPATITLPAHAVSAAKMQQINWSSLDGDIDWTLGPPRACMDHITLPDVDVPPSSAYVAELERLRMLEESFEGPTLLDWEEELSRGGSPHRAEERSDPSITEAPYLAPVPVETEEPALTKIMMEDVPAALPTIVEELEPPAAPEPQTTEPQATPQTPEEQPSQIELPPLESIQGQQRQARRTRVKPIMDPITYISNDAIKMQIKSHLDTLRCRSPSEEISNLELLKLHKKDFFSPKPLHRGVMADTLLKLFVPCATEAVFRDAESPVHEVARGVSQVEEKDLSAVPSLLQDTSTASLQRSRSTLIEPPTGLIEEVPLPLQSIEEHEVPAQAILPPPSPGDMPPPAAEQGTEKPKRIRKRSDADVGKTTQSDRDTDASGQTYVAAVPETSKEELPGPQGEETELSEFPDQSMSESEALTRMVLDCLASCPEAFFNDLLPQDPTDKEAGHLFDHLLQMYKDRKVRLLQDHVFGPIRVTIPQAAEH